MGQDKHSPNSFVEKLRRVGFSVANDSKANLRLTVLFRKHNLYLVIQ